MKIKIILSLVLMSTLQIATAGQEQCVDGVRGMLPWAKGFKGDAHTWNDTAKSNGYNVDKNVTSDCASKGCILVYERGYGGGIDTKYGHVAVIYKKDGAKYAIADSNGLCGGNRKSCSKAVNFDAGMASVIHAK